MGINVSKSKLVSLTDAHERLVVTHPDKNPVEYDLGLEKYLTAVFQRKKARNRTGDGNPLIYALKNMHRFSISDEDRASLFGLVKSIITRHYQGEVFDRILPLPSSKPVVFWVAQACQEALGVPVERNAFVKATNANVLNQLQQVESHKEIIELRKLLEASKPNAVFTMKDLSQFQRQFVEPVRLNPFFTPAGRVLLVDDLVSSGATFKSGYLSVKNKHPEVDIEFLSLLGPVT